MREEEYEKMIKMEEDLEKYKKCVDMIKDLLPERVEEIEDLEGWFEEVKWMVKCLEDAL